MIRADSRFALRQWETALHCNDVSHWLSASLESALMMMVVIYRTCVCEGTWFMSSAVWPLEAAEMTVVACKDKVWLRSSEGVCSALDSKRSGDDDEDDVSMSWMTIWLCGSTWKKLITYIMMDLRSGTDTFTSGNKQTTCSVMPL